MSPTETLEQSESWTCTDMGLKRSLKLWMSLLLFNSLTLTTLSYSSENPQNFTRNTSPFSSSATLTLYHASSKSALYSISASSNHDDMSFLDSFVSVFFFFEFWHRPNCKKIVTFFFSFFWIFFFRNEMNDRRGVWFVAKYMISPLKNRKRKSQFLLQFSWMWLGERK